MAGPVAGEADRGMSARTRRAGTGTAAVSIAVLLALGLALRLIIAYVLLPGSGFGTDVSSFQAWASYLAQHGPGAFYQQPFFHDYTPAYMYVLWLLGIFGQALGGVGDLVKLPAIVSDTVLAWLVWSMVQELGGSRRAALVGAAIVVVNPITWFDSAVWGQVDSVGTVVLLLALRELWRDRPERAAALGVLAAIVKPQLGIIIPIGIAVLLKRYLGRGDEGRSPIRLVTSTGAALATAIAVCLPFGLSLPQLVVQVVTAAAGYPWVTVNAYNPWALVTYQGNGLAATLSWVHDMSGTAVDGTSFTGLMFGPVPALYIGSALLLLVVLLASAYAYIRDDREGTLIALTVLAIAFFVVPTRVHERYLFPFFGLGAILAAVSMRWRWAYVALAAANFVNLYAVLTWPFYKNPGISDWLGLGDAPRSAPVIALVAVIHLGGFLWAAWQMRPGRRSILPDTSPGVLTRPAVAAAALAPAALAPAAPGASAPTASALTGAIPAGATPAGATPAGSTPAGATPEPTAAGIMGFDSVEPVRPMAAPSPTSLSGAPPAPPASGSSTSPHADAGVGSIPQARLDEPASDGEPGGDEEEPGGWFAVPAFLRRQLFARPARPDRSASLHGESTGRLDRLDLWVVVFVILASLTLRMWRLEEPYSMHFDEVYHARTATEFLQDWRYGMPHAIYEYTHPHLAKYVMAGGLVAFGDDKVTATSDLGVPAKAALVEPRWDDPSRPDSRLGDRLYVATGSSVRIYDLQSRALLADLSVGGADALALDPTGHRVFIGSANGAISVIDTNQLDNVRAGIDRTVSPPLSATSVDMQIVRLFATDDGHYLLVQGPNGVVVSIDAATATVYSRTTIPGLSGFAMAGSVDTLLAVPSQVPDHKAAATLLASLTGADAATLQARLDAGQGPVGLLSQLSTDQRAKVEAAITDGRLGGFTFDSVPWVAVADRDGVGFLDPATGQVSDALNLQTPATGIVAVSNLDAPRLYVADGHSMAVIKLSTTPMGQTGYTPPILDTTFDMPGAVRDVAFDPSSVMVHVLGTTQDGKASTIYVIEPHGNAVYADARLPFTPAAWATDAAPLYPSADRQQLLVFAANGAAASVDIGSHAYAWRLPGVIAGALTGAALYLLCRILFRRRSIGIIAAFLTLVDGMFFVQSRIGMNDVYVCLFIVAAYALFAAIWTGVWKSRWAFWIGMPIVGVLLGLALASKWVALYAIAAIVILILARSALGRIIVILSLAAGSAMLGYLAIAEVPPGLDSATAALEHSGSNVLFLVLMVAITLATAAICALHPIRWSLDEVRFAVAAPGALGIVAALAGLALGGSSTLLGLGFLLIVVAALAAGAFRLAANYGLGPLAPPPAPDDPINAAEPPAPAAQGWLSLGSGFGIPAVWLVGSILVLPLVVYVVSYIPWFELGNCLVTCAPGSHGQTFMDLQASMYDYHNNLRATHPASSPWWAWAFDLKPVWFYQGSFATNTAASIYDMGNVAIWWMMIPATAFATWQAYKRRSLGLALLVVALFWQWLAWARIDRATFQYHFYTTLPFSFAALAYFIAELWHGASSRTWLLARVAAAVAILGVPLLWIFKGPLCGLAAIDPTQYPGSVACGDTAGNLVVQTRIAVLVVVIAAAVIALLWQLIELDRASRLGKQDGGRRMAIMVATAAAAAVLLLGGAAAAGDGVLFTISVLPASGVAIVAAIPLLFVAYVALVARDSRRFVVGLLWTFALVFVVIYPNIAALPLPASMVNFYQGVLPTWLYVWQFPVNTAAPVTVKLLSGGPALLFAVLLVASVVVAYSAWVWRIVLAQRRAGQDGNVAIDPDG